jgi:hypothetical protein
MARRRPTHPPLATTKRYSAPKQGEGRGVTVAVDLADRAPAGSRRAGSNHGPPGSSCWQLAASLAGLPTTTPAESCRGQRRAQLLRRPAGTGVGGARGTATTEPAELEPSRQRIRTHDLIKCKGNPKNDPTNVGPLRWCTGLAWNGTSISYPRYNI